MYYNILEVPNPHFVPSKTLNWWNLCLNSVERRLHQHLQSEMRMVRQVQQNKFMKSQCVRKNIAIQ